MRSISPEDVLEAGDVLHHPAFGFATVDATDGAVTMLRWERPGSAHPTRVGPTGLQASYRRIDPRGFLARSVADADIARSLLVREPLDALALLLLDLGGGGKDAVRDWLFDRRIVAEARFDSWWSALLPLAAADGRFEVKGSEVQLREGIDYPAVLAMLEAPLPRAGTLGVSALWPFARRLARATAEAHAAGDGLIRERAAVRMGAGGVSVGALPGNSPASRREDVAFAMRLVLEQLLGTLPSPKDLPDADVCCLVLGVEPGVPPEFLAVAQSALAADPALRPADGLALLERLTTAQGAAALRASAPHFPQAAISVGFNTHIGTIKSLQGQTNQDAFLLLGDPTLALVGVADGISMSTAGSGDVAAALTGKSLRAWFSENAASLASAPAGRVSTLLVEALRRANRQVCEQALKLADGDIEHNIPMGTTLVAAVCQGNRLSLVSLGDSRAYLVGPYGVGQVTPDQNLQLLRLREVLGGNEVEWDEPRHSLTGYLGHFTAEGRIELPPVYTRSVAMLPGEWLILCSDGLSDYAASEDAGVLKVIQDGIRDARGNTAGAVAMDVARRLVDAANRGGGGDNITVLALTLSPDYGATASDSAVPS